KERGAGAGQSGDGGSKNEGGGRTAIPHAKRSPCSACQRKAQGTDHPSGGYPPCHIRAKSIIPTMKGLVPRAMLAKVKITGTAANERPATTPRASTWRNDFARNRVWIASTRPATSQ